MSIWVIVSVFGRTLLHVGVYFRQIYRSSESEDPRLNGKCDISSWNLNNCRVGAAEDELGKHKYDVASSITSMATSNIALLL
jgi:hypothetical protein